MRFATSALAVALTTPAFAARPTGPDVAIIADGLNNAVEQPSERHINTKSLVVQIVAPKTLYGTALWAKNLCIDMRTKGEMLNNNWTLKFWVYVPGPAEPLLDADMIGECIVGPEGF
jgi:hypothetical protein